MEMLFGVLGGLGLFLYGMNVMSTGLQKAAGDKLKSIISLLTSSKIMSVLVGAGVTAIVQSSSATTVMVVGFVNAGMMKLTQAVGLIMGANIGTTITAQVITFKIDKYAPIIVGISVGVWLFTSNRKVKQIAEAFIGFGILFIGMKFMGDALRPLRAYQPFKDLLVSFGEHPFLGILAGFAITVAVQSSSASTGILLALAMEGLIPISSGLPILFGINMGTTITAIISSIGANITAKRAAAFHFLFNFIGTIIFIFILRIPLYRIINVISPGDVPRQIANAHTIFNVTSTILLLPFAGLLVKIAKRIVPGEEEAAEGIKYIDERILETPSIALSSVVKETLHMGNVAKDSYKNSLEALIERDYKKIEETKRIEKIVNELEREISKYLVKLSNTNISAQDREVVDGLFSTINDIERVGDHAENVAELAEYMLENDLAFTEDAVEELKHISGIVMEAYTDSLTVLTSYNYDLARKVTAMEEEVDVLERRLRASHIERLNTNKCVPSSGVIFLDLISNLERIADHASNIVMPILDHEKKKKNK
ncbi:Na/Pi cotransporter family protein [Serpentinicella alkaliphila]|uniref:Phosphate:Na+ symporter n=1 Tax=Serpentinicella alkaliphila TaxID=1734049 RepID=A0A4R2TIQ0_9FIRM|nr:Na/Pi cotransporter family protein [Serpentinicella alkaliphila]QUH24635.1 Na/Pi cotransporter family protein [Serpentinicella alkaliphila]TCQ02636.1 phosphate:Na+ symporter [Serpentinicella alkaliphila]